MQLNHGSAMAQPPRTWNWSCPFQFAPPCGSSPWTAWLRATVRAVADGGVGGSAMLPATLGAQYPWLEGVGVVTSCD